RGQSRHTSNERRSRFRWARHRKIHCPGHTQVAWLRDNCRFGGESCETGDQNGEKSGAAKEYSNAHAKAPSRLAQSSLSCKFENLPLHSSLLLPHRDAVSLDAYRAVALREGGLNVGRFHPKYHPNHGATARISR